MTKKTKSDSFPRIGSFSDKEVFEIDLTKMSTAFMAAFLSRPDNKFMTLKDKDMKAIAQQSVIMAHELMIEIQECVEKYGEE